MHPFSSPRGFWLLVGYVVVHHNDEIMRINIKEDNVIQWWGVGGRWMSVYGSEVWGRQAGVS